MAEQELSAGEIDDVDEHVEKNYRFENKESPARRKSQFKPLDDDVHPLNRNLWNPYNLWIFLSFGWLNGLMQTGKKRPLTDADLHPIPAEERAGPLTDKIEEQWNAQKEHRSLARVYVSAFMRRIVTISIGLCIETAFLILGPYCLSGLLESLANNDSDKTIFLWGFGLVMTSFFTLITHHVAFLYSWLLGMETRLVSIGLVYRKLLRVTRETLSQHASTGHVISLSSSDAEKFVQSGIMLHYLWIAPLGLVVVVYLMWVEIGPSCLAGVSLLLLTVPLHFFNSKFYANFRKKTALTTDSRVKLVNELFSGMRVVKMYSWEAPWAEWIGELRGKELGYLRKTNIVRALNFGFNFASSILLGFLSFMTYELSGHEITARKVFVVLSLFNSVRVLTSFFFPVAVLLYSELKVVFQRLEAFLRLPEVESRKQSTNSILRSSSLKLNNSNPSSRRISWVDEVALSSLSGLKSLSPNHLQPVLEVSDLSCVWSNKASSVLSDVSFSLRKGQLLACVGPVGSGKSTLLLAILGEIKLQTGTLNKTGKIGYASQEAWIISESVRENIVFGRPFEQEWYDAVVDACCLREDLERFPDGDRSQIGERGVTLSGGQRARLSLARTVYARPDIILLDDPLSAVDVKVGRRLFEMCIKGLLRESAVLLVTHQLQFVSKADLVLVLSAEGKASEVYTPNEEVLHQISEQHLAEEDKDPDSEESTASTDPKASKNLFQSEDKQVGAVGFRTLLAYVRASGSWISIIALISLCLLTQGAALISDWYLSYWVSKSDSDRKSGFYLGIYGLIVGIFTLFAFARPIFMYLAMMKSSRNLHDQALSAVVHSPIRFFDTNPVGRILNRFSSDLAVLDDMLPLTLMDVVQLGLLIFGIFFLVSSINPWIFLVAVPLVGLFVYVRIYYMYSAREIKRLESINRSPIYSHLSFTISGLITIRSLGAGAQLQKDFEGHQNSHTRAFFAFLTTSRWLAFRLDMMTFVFVAMTVFIGLAIKDSLSPGKIGLSVLYALQLAQVFQWTVRQTAELENQMVSVERLVSYRELPTEEKFLDRSILEPSTYKQALLESKSSTWPSKGGIEFKDLSMQYSPEDPLVLKNLNLSIHPGEKVGIVGRTGAGKSSILSALFNLSPINGRLEIDNIECRAMSLFDWRSKISVIPQDPVLFSGTLRKNLDPFGQCDDARIWQALEDVCLKKVVEDMNGGLDSKMSEAGGNLSVGQRQLVCLARAILRTNKILLLDEATANVDNETDSLIQKTIRSKFKACTVLTIAHRLHTIMDSDRILVMDAGRAVEFDSPQALLENADGYFSSMVAQNPDAARRVIPRGGDAGMNGTTSKNKQNSMTETPPEGARPVTSPESRRVIDFTAPHEGREDREDKEEWDHSRCLAHPFSPDAELNAERKQSKRTSMAWELDI